MKKIISLILCVLMIVPMFAFAAYAADEVGGDQKPFNFAEEGSAYGTSKWNNDSDPKYINNGDQSDSYRYWRPNGHGRDIFMDDTEQLCGIRYQGGKYYEVQTVDIYAYIEGKENDYKIVVEALVLGEWIKIGEARNSDAQSTGMFPVEDGTEVGRITIDVEDTVTKHIRFKFSEYGRWATSCIVGTNPDGTPNYNNDYDNPETDVYDPQTNWNHWWKIPCVHEIETWGVEAPAPAWDVPEGAILSTNACLSGYADATSTNTLLNIYPALVNDDVKYPTLSVPRPYWQANVRNPGGGQSVWSTFDQPYDIVNVSLNFGGSVDGVTMVYDVEILVDGSWVSVATSRTATSSVASQEDIVYTLDKVYRASAVRVNITSSVGENGRDAAAVLTEMGALIYDQNKNEKGEIIDKCVFLKDFITPNKKESASAGNLAMFGTAYASSVMTYANMSSIDYINDGEVHDDLSYSWFAQTFERGTFCGVILEETYAVDKIVMFFNDPITGNKKGENVMLVDIQAKVNGQFVTVKSGVTSYDASAQEYKVSVVLDAPVNTDDIRIVYQSNGMVFPYIKELEVYSTSFRYGSYKGYPSGARVDGGKLQTAEFAKRTIVPRSKYLDMISPIQYFNVTAEYGIDVQAWM